MALNNSGQIVDWRYRFLLAVLILLGTAAVAVTQVVPPYGQYRRNTRPRNVVNAVAFSNDGKLMAISRGSNDYLQHSGQVDLCNVESGEIIRSMKGFDGPVISVVFTPDGATLVTASLEMREAKLHKSPARIPLYNELKWWDVKTGELKFKQSKTNTERRTVVNTISADGRTVANVEYFSEQSVNISSPMDASGDGGRFSSPFTSYTTTNIINLNLLNASNGDRLAQSKGLVKTTTTGIRPSPFGGSFLQTGAVFSPGGDLLALGNSDEIRVWSVKNNSTVLRLKKFKGSARSLAFSPDGRVLAVAEVITERKRSGDKMFLDIHSELKFYQIPNGELLNSIKYAGGINFVSFTVDGPGMLVGTTDVGKEQFLSRLGRLDLTTGKIADVLAPQRGGRSFTVSPSGQFAATSDSRTVTVWDIQKHQVKHKFEDTSDTNRPNAVANRYVLDVHRVLAVKFSPTGNTLIAGNEEKEIKMWDPRTGELKNKLTGHEGGVSGIAISSDGKTVYSGSEDQTVRLWDTQSGSQKNVLHGNGDEFESIALSRDEKLVAAIGEGVSIWDAETGELLRSFGTDLAPANAVVFGADGHTLVTAGDDGIIRLWNADTGEPGRPIATENKITAMAYSRQNNIVAVGGGDGTIGIWSLSTGARITSFKKHNGPVNALAFSADGKWMASAGDDRKAIVWETNGWDSKHALKQIDMAATTLDFSPDGQMLAAGCGNLSVIVWDVRTGDLNRVLK